MIALLLIRSELLNDQVQATDDGSPNDGRHAQAGEKCDLSTWRGPPGGE